MINDKNRSKVLLTIIGILLVANIALISFFLVKKDDSKREKPDRRTMIAGFLKKEIGFSETQLRKYDSISNWHTRYMKTMFEASRNSKDKQFRELTASGFSDSVMNSIADRSASSQKALELQMFTHLKNVRMLCTTAQVPLFDSLFPKMLHRRNGEGRKKQQEKK